MEFGKVDEQPVKELGLKIGLASNWVSWQLEVSILLCPSMAGSATPEHSWSTSERWEGKV